MVLNEGSKDTKKEYNKRKLVELPYALIRCKRWSKIAEQVCSIPFIEVGMNILYQDCVILHTLV